MGSATSKTTRSAARAAPKRQYPQHVPPHTPSNPAPPQRTTGPTANPPPHASSTRDDTINRDAADPDFARSLRSLGPVTPSPQFSNSSAFLPREYAAEMEPNRPNVYPDPARNPALRILEARSRLAREAEEEFGMIGKEGAAGRRFLDVLVLRQVLQMRDVQGLGAREIERRLELREGVLERLGRKGVVAEPS